MAKCLNFARERGNKTTLDAVESRVVLLQLVRCTRLRSSHSKIDNLADLAPRGAGAGSELQATCSTVVPTDNREGVSRLYVLVERVGSGHIPERGVRRIEQCPT